MTRATCGQCLLIFQSILWWQSSNLYRRLVSGPYVPYPPSPNPLVVIVLIRADVRKDQTIIVTVLGGLI